jgi:hypothetical protein
VEEELEHLVPLGFTLVHTRQMASVGLPGPRC